MLDDFNTFIRYVVLWFKALYVGIGSWGIIGAFIICYGLLRKLIVLLKKLWKGGI